MTATLGADIIRASDGSDPVEFPDGIITGNLNGENISGGIATDADVAASIATHNGIVASATQAGHVFELATASEAQAGTDAQRVLTPLSIQDVLFDLGYAADWYLDSVNGNDLFTGLSKSTAFQTVAKILTVIQVGDVIGVARGSHLREQLDPGANDVTIRAYGSGAPPIFDGSDIVANASFSKTGGLTNVYDISVTPAWLSGQSWVNVLEDGAFLARASSSANCDATPGSYFPSGSSGTITLYVHASDSSDLTTNGKVYEYTQRAHGIYTYDRTGITLVGLECRNQLGEGGALKVGRSSTVRDCISRNGSKHNAFSREDTTWTNCIFYNAYYGTNGSSMFVLADQSPTGKTITLTNCVCAMPSASSLVAGFFWEAVVGGTYSTLTFEGCSCVNTAMAFSGSAATAINLTNCSTSNVTASLRIDQASATYTLSGVTFSQTGENVIQFNAAGASLVVNNSSLYSAYTGGTGSYLIRTAFNNCSISLTSVTFDGSGSFPIAVYTSGTGNTLYARTNVMTDATLYASFYGYVTGDVIDSDYNTFKSGINFRFNGSYRTLEQWRSDTGQDTHST